REPLPRGDRDGTRARRCRRFLRSRAEPPVGIARRRGGLLRRVHRTGKGRCDVTPQERLTLSAFVSVTRTGLGVMLRSGTAAYRVGGHDAVAFAEKVLPLLDGTRDEEGVVAALSGYSRASVLALLGWLRERRLLDGEQPRAPGDAASAEVFRAWKADAGE